MGESLDFDIEYLLRQTATISRDRTDPKKGNILGDKNVTFSRCVVCKCPALVLVIMLLLCVHIREMLSLWCCQLGIEIVCAR